MEMIRASDEEIETALHIAVTTAPNYVLREVFAGKFDRERAVETIVQRVFAALRRYELMREPRAEEVARSILPLFTDDRPTAAEVPTLFEHEAG
ncbi:hypothetical protein [Pelagerythrobacter marinus]|uniref:hypothetical protein n=1 Tax=Pelagerythrobacter marinus TaxID=538382 RepID=UPI002036BE7A|nr:hypothetical protein [Pelagerythrobacter marinus]MEC9067790.1 hypothetical protein [Pseudomonadota bacterium]USA40193.1 hypothetical protein NCF86_03285 [Pelagerythrobacter marinus]WPZ05682.1 hypothetical protein T8T98_09590 [Pelagerythrobacter marinus]